MEKDSVAGTLRVYGCAAEESAGVKVYMARDGLFDDLDACLAWHSAPMAMAGAVRAAAVNQIQVEFFGKAAHAGFAPWEGRSALHALELFAHGVNLMREHVEPTARIQYTFDIAGAAVNVVSDYTRLRLTIRDKDRGRVEAITEWARQIAVGAALGTQTRTKFEVQFGMWDLLPNGPIIERTYANMAKVGMPQWTDEEQSFARACQVNMGVPELGMATKLSPLAPEISVGGSTDVADVSWNTPTGVFVMPTLPLGVGLHTWPVTACGGMSIGLKGALAAAAVMTATGYDLLTDAELRAAARAHFAKRKGAIKYVSAVSQEQHDPAGLAWMLKMPTKKWWRCRRPAKAASRSPVMATALSRKPHLTAGGHSWPVTILLALVSTAVILLIADLDRPQQGLLKVSQQPMIDFLNKIGAPAP